MHRYTTEANFITLAYTRSATVTRYNHVIFEANGEIVRISIGPCVFVHTETLPCYTMAFLFCF